MTTTTRRPLTTCSTISMLLLCLLLFIATVGHCAAESKVPTTPRNLVAAIPADLPPTYFLDKSGKPAGFAVDVMNELARRTGLTVEYVSGQAFDDVIQMVLTGKADLIPSLTIDERRKELLAFTDTVGFLPANLFVASGNLTVQEISPGLTIGVIKGSAPENLLMKNQTIQLTTYTNLQTMLFELLAGHVDGIVFLTPNLMKLAIDAGVEDKIKVVGKPIIEAKRGIALRKGDTELLTRLNKAIGEFIGSPEYQQIYIKWYGKPKPYWTADKIGAVSGLLLVLIVLGMVFWRYRSIVRLNNRLMLSMAENKQAEDALRESEANYRQLFDNSPSGIYKIDFRTGKFLKANDIICKYLGYSQEEITSLNPHDFLTDEGKQLFSERLNKLMLGEEVAKTPEFEIVDKKGMRRWVQLNSKFFYDSEGLAGADVVAHEITERKRAEEELLKSEEEFRSLAEAMPQIVWATRKDGWNIYFNQQWINYTGLTLEESYGHGWNTPFHPEDRQRAWDAWQDATKTGGIYSLECRLRRADGVYHWWLIRGVPLLDETGEIIKWFGTCTDIDNIKHAEKQLQDTLESLRKAIGTTIQVMVSAVETRDPYTSGHQTRSANLARAIAMEMGLPEDKIDAIRMAGSIHDIGKLSIPAEILSKPTKLSAIEWLLIKEHAQRGYEILKDVESPWPLAEIVHQHHERMDGSGYPRSLKGEEILIEARILSVADVVEAMASHRPYRPGLGIDAALNEIEKNSGIFYDATVADACLRLFREKGFKLEGS
jgi:PAS domain S-box-containing protein